MASAHGVENRCPFLDRRIIEFAFSLPSHLKIDGLETKVLLRRILRRRDPSWQDSEKVGLFCSVNEWLGVPDAGFDKSAWVSAQREALGPSHRELVASGQLA